MMVGILLGLKVLIINIAVLKPEKVTIPNHKGDLNIKDDA
jgi:hypothetical protein